MQKTPYLLILATYIPNLAVAQTSRISAIVTDISGNPLAWVNGVIE